MEPKKLSFEEMDSIQGGITWACGMALASIGLSIAAFLTMPAGAVAALIWGGSHLLATANVIDACGEYIGIE